jgi:2-polyprenyl-3-methyl-5-hydroxy-6-metoxy-1,4-benzoquinol methylase
MADQEVFRTVYRQRQSWFHHLAYLRRAKVLLTHHLLSQAGVRLAGRRVLDYGFGAGTFFMTCPRDARLFGVEMDPVHVTQVQQLLATRGFDQVRLEPIDPEGWESHPLLAETYDVILCSHVLEHLPDPVAFLRRITRCLAPGGVFAGLVPVNERQLNPHHVQAVDEAMVRSWVSNARLELQLYLESDPWLYWVQPLYNHDANSPHRLAVALARMLSLSLGAVATALGPRAWAGLSPWFAAVTRSCPTQAAFVVQARPASAQAGTG